MSKEKQIEEMARDICEAFSSDGTCYWDKKPCDFRCAEFTQTQYIYEKGYRKQSVGEWITGGNELKNTTCSVCGYWVETPYGKTPYCPNCGAKMKGGAE